MKRFYERLVSMFCITAHILIYLRELLKCKALTCSVWAVP